MVLEEAANASTDASFNEKPPSSDADPYYGDSNPTYLDSRPSSYFTVNSPPHTVYVNIDQLPKRVSLFGTTPFSTSFEKALQANCREVSHTLGRPVRQEEADALAYHGARALRTASFGGTIGTALGYVWAWRGRAKFQFPGWTPGEKFNPERLGPFRGRGVRIFWYTLRYMVYGMLGGFIGQMGMGSYAMSQGAVARFRDPRLKEYTEAIVARNHPRAGNKALGNRQTDDTPGQREGETYEMARQRQRAQEAWNRNRSAQQQEQQTQRDDMSPSGGAFGAEYIDLGSATVSDTSMMTDAQAKQQLERMESQQKADYAERRAPERSGDAPRYGSSGDAPPTSQVPCQQSSSSGSAWERLRQQAASGGQQQPSSGTTPQSRSRDNASDGDSFGL